MDSREPASCCFLSTSRDHPLHLFDAFTGRLRASYRAFDHLDEIVAAFSCTFSIDGGTSLAGYDRCIRTFDVAAPGKAVSTFSTSATRKSREGQRGMISALAVCPGEDSLFAAGSYRGSVCLYDIRSGRCCLELGNGVGGITQLKFSPDGRFLFSGSRRGLAVSRGAPLTLW